MTRPSGKIYTLSLFPAIDTTLYLEGMEPVRELPAQREHSEAGGKGANTAAALTALGLDCACICLMGEENAGLFLRLLDAAGVRCIPIPLPGRIRENLSLETPQGQYRVMRQGFRADHRALGRLEMVLRERLLYGDNVIEKHGINRDSTGDREKTRYLCGKQGIFTRDRALIRPGFIRQLETRASTRSASFFHALGSPGRPHNGGGEAGAYRTRNGAKPLKQGHLRAKRGPLGPSRKSQQQTKRTGFAAHGHSIAETAPEGKRASCANGALIRA